MSTFNNSLEASLVNTFRQKRVSFSAPVWTCNTTNISSYQVQVKDSVEWHDQTTGAKDARQLQHLAQNEHLESSDLEEHQGAMMT